MKKWMSGLGILTVIIGFSFRLHPYYISMTEMVFNAKEKQMEISVRVFTDDLEKELAGHCRCRVDLLKREDSLKNSNLLKQYFQRTIKIKVNQASKKLVFLGFEQDEESIWSYLEFEQTEEPRDLFIENGILFSTQPKQTNLVRLRAGTFDKTHQLVYPKKELRFEVK